MFIGALSYCFLKKNLNKNPKAYSILLLFLRWTIEVLDLTYPKHLKWTVLYLLLIIHDRLIVVIQIKGVRN